MTASPPEFKYKRIRTALPLSFGFVRPPSVFVGPDHILIARPRLFSEQNTRVHFADVEAIAVRQDNRSLYSVPTNLVVCLASVAMGVWLLIEGTPSGNVGAMSLGVVWFAVAVIMLLKVLVTLAAGQSMLLTLSTATQQIEMHLGARYLNRLLDRHLLPSLAAAQGATEDLESKTKLIVQGKVAPASRRIAESEREPISVRFLGTYLRVSIIGGLLMFASEFYPRIAVLDTVMVGFGFVMLAWMLAVIVHVFRRRASPSFRGTFVLYLWLAGLGILSEASKGSIITTTTDISGAFAAMSRPEMVHDILRFVAATSVEILLLAQLRSYRDSFWGDREFVFYAPLTEID